MESAPLASHSPQNHKKRVQSESSSSYMDSDVVEIPPPKSWRSSSKSLKQKEVVCYEVIDSDQDEDVIIIGEKVCKNKGKAVVHVSDGPSSNKSEKGLADHLVVPTIDASHSSDLNSYNFNFFSNDIVDVDEYAMVQALFESADIPPGVEASIPWWPDSPFSKQPELEPMSTWSYPEVSQSKKKPFSGLASSSLQAQNSGLNAFGGQPSTWGDYNPTPSVINGTSSSVYPSFDPKFNTLDIRTGSILSRSKDSAESSTSRVTDENEDDEILKRLKLFKKFDMVDDHSDHHYASQGSFAKQTQPPKNWAKKIQDEWKILENDLPDTIFVRVYESRIDLMRAVIVGAEGTPYHDSLFFFDISFPSSYPNGPPDVHYHAHGLRLNPNLYNCGKVCLSLLNTWQGRKNEKWIPGKSTMLQVLVSIQALILNVDPYFNEPGYASSRGTKNGIQASANYNESTLILSLRTMIYTLKKPPKHFMELVNGHFYKHAHIILQSCKAYIEGAQVGSLVKGVVKNVEESSQKSSSKKGTYAAKQVVTFKDNVAALVNQLVSAFTKTGAKDCEKFSSPRGAQGSNQASTMPSAGYYGGGSNPMSMMFNAPGYYGGSNPVSMMPNHGGYGF